MPYYDTHEDVFLSPSGPSSRKSPPSSRQSSNLNNRKSSASLRAPSPSAMADDSANGRHSLAHELAVALMPEPSVGSRLLAEEFGIEYDEGAEGIDEVHIGAHDLTPEIHIEEAPSFADNRGIDPPQFDTDESDDASFHSRLTFNDPAFDDPTFASPTSSSRRRKQKSHPSKPKVPEKDPMELLARDLESTDTFLSHLRRLDSSDPTSSAPQQPALERLASDVIRRMNDTVRDREVQVRELLEYEREFRRIAGEVGGSDVLSRLDELETDDGDVPEQRPAEPLSSLSKAPEPRNLVHIAEEADWETDPDQDRLYGRGDGSDDDDDPFSAEPSPTKDNFPPAPPISGPPTPASTLPHLAHLRTFTTSLVSSLGTISEQAQVNGAATAEAGRRIRALKNKMGGWRVEWESAERSRVRVESWEAGGDGDSTPGTPGRVARRVDGRRVVEEHLKAFEGALKDAAVKTQAIMAA
ncbi:hypothetical protein BD779DRAFT_1671877 [Infundibulicybe gibba]|nr:hypothetical protein BD779DRAFT_1671877 [Infundibulicybe gibba]